MTQSSDPKLVEFLTNNQNVGCVLEVLKHGEEIRKTLTERFWSELRTHLTTTTPKRFSRTLKWDLGSELDGKRGSFAWLDAQIAQFADYPQSLFYRIEYYAWPQGLHLYFGLHWKVKTRPSTRNRQTGPLQPLLQFLEEDEYDLTEPEWWCGWRFVRQFPSPDDFLSFFLDNRKFLFLSIGDGLWAFVERTMGHVEKVNWSLKV